MSKSPFSRKNMITIPSGLTCTIKFGSLLPHTMQVELKRCEMATKSMHFWSNLRFPLWWWFVVPLSIRFSNCLLASPDVERCESDVRLWTQSLHTHLWHAMRPKHHGWVNGWPLFEPPRSMFRRMRTTECMERLHRGERSQRKWCNTHRSPR